MRFPWSPALPKNPAAERKLVAEARKLGETMTLMVGRMEVLVDRLHEELGHHGRGQEDDGERSQFR